MQLAGVRLNLCRTLHHLPTAWDLFRPHHRVGIFPFQVSFNAWQSRRLRGTATPWPSIWINANCHTADCVFDSPDVALMLLSSKRRVSHICGTPTRRTWTHPEGSIIPRLVSVACTLVSVSVFWLQGLSIYSFKSPGHLLDLWWWRLWPWDLSGPRRNKVSCRESVEKEAVSLSGSWPIAAMLGIPSARLHF